jgi:hypothetical protein
MKAMRRNGPLRFNSWSIVTNPPNGMMTVMSFPNETEARERLAEWKRNGRAEHCYVQAPTVRGAENENA